MKKIVVILSVLSLILPVFSATLNIGRDKIVKVNNAIITQNELERRYNEIAKLQESMGGEKPTKKSVLQTMIEEKLLQEEIRQAKNLILDDNQYDYMMKQYKDMFTYQRMQQNREYQYNDEDFKTYIVQEAKVTYERFEERIKEQVLVRQYIMKKVEKDLQSLREKKYNSKSDFPIEIQNEQGGYDKYGSLDDFYDQNGQLFFVPTHVEVKHIFVATVGMNNQPLPDGEKEIKRKKINDAYKRLKKGENFNEICELYSEDVESRDQKNPKTGKLDRGYLGPVVRTGELSEVWKKQIGEANVEKLFNYKKGNFTSIIDGPFGFHIFYILDKKSQYIRPLPEAKDEIIEYFKLAESDKLVADEFKNTLNELKKKASIVYYKNEYKNQ